MLLNDPTGRKAELPPEPDTILVPYIGRVSRPDGAWQPTNPGPQGHNAGITPGFRRDRRSKSRPHFATTTTAEERLDETETLLCEALARLARLEIARTGG